MEEIRALMLRRHFVPLLFTLFLCFPYIALFFYLGEVRFSFSAEVQEVYWSTAVQAFFSALFSLVFGIVGAYGLNWWRRRHAQIFNSVIVPLTLVPRP